MNCSCNGILSEINNDQQAAIITFLAIDSMFACGVSLLALLVLWYGPGEIETFIREQWMKYIIKNVTKRRWIYIILSVLINPFLFIALLVFFLLLNPFLLLYGIIECWKVCGNECISAKGCCCRTYKWTFVDQGEEEEKKKEEEASAQTVTIVEEE